MIKKAKKPSMSTATVAMAAKRGNPMQFINCAKSSKPPLDSNWAYANAKLHGDRWAKIT
ncbi:MAG: hypothetical protein MO846_09845 [Candidatus Devosia symbiotica]|nr:hypothetical protein [Candidatus Devosia symbiotica]